MASALSSFISLMQRIVILSAAKDPGVASEILRCAQDDRSLPILLVNSH